ncbi:hypothetical protein OE88DRAFT_658144 [Heliocybe sulcata]|uniref:Ubiquitin-like-conjugating enzyme ATG10 n=1 Tax=Heliocybe sulcata TaxID=5364 RepID=A0A5C3NDJ6_9AGAM|nr:hypothetical protein OE88DRAFT_658144 [Heliocybe sulcata]
MSPPPAHLTRSEFETASKALVDDAREGGDALAQRHLREWSWVEHASVSGLGYLSRTVLLSRRPGCRSYELGFTDGLDGEAILEEEDGATLSDADPSDTVVCRQYVVYSPTYQVPVFYFTIHASNGAPLSLEDILRSSLFRPDTLPPSQITSFALSPDSSPFPLLSQGDHPTLGTPSWYVHPCETPKAVGEILAEVQRPQGTATKELMRVWFAVLGGVVDLRP